MDPIDHFDSILSNYNIGEISSITSHESGTKNKGYEIWIEGQKKYFLREKDSSTIYKDLEYDHSLTNYFSENHISTPFPVNNNDGNTITEFSGSYYELTKYYKYLADGYSSRMDVTNHLVQPTRAVARKLACFLRKFSKNNHPYLVLLPVGFALPYVLPHMRCALTAPFHPYLN